MSDQSGVRRCSNCGVDNDDAAVFCSGCDHFLQWEVAPRRVRSQRAEPAEPAPVVVAPPEPAPVVVAPAAVPPLSHNAHDIIRALDAGCDLAATQERPDLTEHLDNARERLAAASATVVVLGEFKRGKSTLINALLQMAVCPVDADVVTAVPTIVMYADSPGVTAYAQDAESGEMVAREMALRDLPRLVSEPAEPGAAVLERSVEVRVPHRLLKAGLRLVDTPGVGGLESVHGYLAMGTLSMADGALFVCDASQELTGPELGFLRTVVERCPATMLVVTKTDLYREWRRIVELNQGHLAAAGLDIAVVPVSSFLRLRATTDPSLDAESGFAELAALLATRVVAPGVARAAAAAAEEVAFVATQVAERADAERAVIAEPHQAPQVLAQLRATTHRTAALSAPSASWQQTLGDAVQDLVADVDHDLQERLRAVLHDVEVVIDQGDPKELWPDTEMWLRRQVAQVAVENRNLLIHRATELTAEVAGRFELDAGRQFELDLETPDRAVTDLPAVGALGAQPGRVASMLLATRSSIYLPMMLFSVLSGIGWVALGAGVAVLLGAGIGQKIIRDETARQRTFRQQQAKAVARKFVDDVAFVLNKDTRDALRMTQRRLREDFQARAASIHLSSQMALEAAQRAAGMDPEQMSVRTRELEQEERKVAGVRDDARRLVTLGAGSSDGAPRMRGASVSQGSSRGRTPDG